MIKGNTSAFHLNLVSRTVNPSLNPPCGEIIYRKSMGDIAKVQATDTNFK